MGDPVIYTYVNLKQALSNIRTAVETMTPQDPLNRFKWTPPASLQSRPADCYVATVDQLETFLAPASRSPKVQAYHRSVAPHRTLLEYSDNHGSRFVMIAYNRITDVDRNVSCGIHYRLAYYTMAALDDFPPPHFAQNAFDLSVVRYLRCLGAGSGDCEAQMTIDIGPYDRATPLPMRAFEAAFRRDSSPTKLLWLYLQKFSRRVQDIGQHILAGLDDDGPLVRTQYQGDVQSVLDAIAQEKLADYTESADAMEIQRRYEKMRGQLMTLLNTTAGRAKFWELRSLLPVSCAEENDAIGNATEVVCKSPGLAYEARTPLHSATPPLRTTQKN